MSCRQPSANIIARSYWLLQPLLSIFFIVLLALFFSFLQLPRSCLSLLGCLHPRFFSLALLLLSFHRSLVPTPSPPSNLHHHHHHPALDIPSHSQQLSQPLAFASKRVSLLQSLHKQTRKLLATHSIASTTCTPSPRRRHQRQRHRPCTLTRARPSPGARASRPCSTPPAPSTPSVLRPVRVMTYLSRKRPHSGHQHPCQMQVNHCPPQSRA